MMLVNGLPEGSVPADDRGLAFGDGVFRTLELLNGQPCLWRWHYARLRADAEALQLAVPDDGVLLRELARAGEGQVRSVAKITLTRGSARRGYAMTAGAAGTRIVNADAWSGYPPALAREGVVLALCSLRLGLQPRLAGIKHLNRLENVLARSEWQDPAISEGLLLDSDGHVVEGTMSNLFVLRDGQWQTPRLDRCGVAGALRAWVMEQQPVAEVRLTLASLLSADEVFVCNSLAGIWPVRRLLDRVWSDFSCATALNARLCACRTAPAHAGG
jgi:4-amino-4-deoxychorismate lyase